MGKNKYYVSVDSKEISRNKVGNNNDFVILASEDDLRELRTIFNQMGDAEMDTFWRSHIPIKPYHHDTGNDKYDSAMKDAYAKIHELGDESAKQFINETGILTHLRLED